MRIHAQLSASVLFHFTSDRHRLLSILRTGFRPFLCCETLPIAQEPFVGAVPMVCFCDIPLSRARRHESVYGSYAIGLSKDWGIANGISPIIYGNPGTELTDSLYRIMNRALGGDGRGRYPGKVDKELWRDAFAVGCFAKPYESDFFKNGRKYPTYRFYDEREWRWVPRVTLDDLTYGIDESEFNDDSAREAANLRIQAEHRLRFDAKDIRYIIVRDEDDLESIVNELDLISGVPVNQHERLLYTKLFSFSQIAADF